MCAKFQQKILNCRVVELVKVFKFSNKIPGFSKPIELCLNFCMGFCITQLALLALIRKNHSGCFFQNRNAHKNFGDKVVLENCMLISKSFYKTLSDILCDWFTLAFELLTGVLDGKQWLYTCSIALYQIFCYYKCNICLEFFAKSPSGNPTLFFKNKAIKRFDY